MKVGSPWMLAHNERMTLMSSPSSPVRDLRNGPTLLTRRYTLSV
jgi:hypothetical protein